MKRLRTIVGFLVVIAVIATANAMTIYDFNTANELNNFNKVLIVNDTIQQFNSSLASVVVANGAVSLTSSEGYAGLEIPAQNGYLYGITGNNVWIGIVYNGTLVGSIQVDKMGYVRVSDGEAILSNGAMKIKVNSPVDYVIFYTNNGDIDKIAILSPYDISNQVQLSAGNHLYSWSGSQDWMTLVHLHSGTRYTITFNQGGYDWDFFLFAPTNPHYSEASPQQSWDWLDDHKDFTLWADSGQESGTYTAPTTGNYKFIVKHFSNSAPGHTWHLYVDGPNNGQQHIQPVGTPSSGSIGGDAGLRVHPQPPASDNPSSPVNFDLHNDNTKLILLGIGIVVLVVLVVGLTNKR